MKFTNLAILGLTASLAAPASAATVITIFFETDLSDTAVDLDNGPALDTISATTPLTANVAEDLTNMLTISVISASSFDPENSNVNASGGGLGINSPTPDGGSENASRFDVDAAESLEFAFSLDVRIISVDLTSLTGAEEFTFGSVTGITDANTPASDVFTFADGGLIFAAGEGILLEATGAAGGSVGLTAITVEVIPEPSTAMLLAMMGGFVGFRRRR